jgi:hypothetical protein
VRDRERAQLDRLKEEKERNKAAAAAAKHREGGSGSLVALTAHAHSSYGRDNYTPLAPGARGAGSGVEYTGDRPSLTNLFSPAMRYISPMKSVTVVSSPAPFVVRHAGSEFITQGSGGGSGAGSGAVSPSVSYPLNTVRASELGGGSMRISRSAVQNPTARKMSSTISNKKE